MAGKQNFTIEKNATFRKRLRYMSKSRRPIDLTGYTAKLQVRATVGDVVALLELTTENGGITLTSTGNITLVVPLAQVLMLTFRTAVYDLILVVPGTDPNRDRIRLLEGRIIVSPGVTSC